MGDQQTLVMGGIKANQIYNFHWKNSWGTFLHWFWDHLWMLCLWDVFDGHDFLYFFNDIHYKDPKGQVRLFSYFSLLLCRPTFCSLLPSFESFALADVFLTDKLCWGHNKQKVLWETSIKNNHTEIVYRVTCGPVCCSRSYRGTSIKSRPFHNRLKSPHIRFQLKMTL